MLILARKVDESIVCGDLTAPAGTDVGPITITVVEIRGDKVRLGIAAPRNIPVHREEIALKIAAAKAAPVLELVASA